MEEEMEWILSRLSFPSLSQMTSISHVRHIPVSVPPPRPCLANLWHDYSNSISLQLESLLTMASTGIDVKDLLPIPHNTQAITNEQDGETSNTLAEPPTGNLERSPQGL